MNDGSASFTGLLDLAARTLGGYAIAASDDFFASANRLLEPGRGTYAPDQFTHQGKWMDGWESRRKRGPGHDWCIVQLGTPGCVLGVDIDTNHFVGNHPPYASLEGTLAPRGSALAELSGQRWVELLAQAPLRPGSQNLFVTDAQPPVSHVRLNIFPDGGVARLRVYGRALADWSRRQLDEETLSHLAGIDPTAVDLAALANGGTPLACSDAFFAPMHHLLLPGRAENQGGGWETRRKRTPGHDWIIIRLGARGRPRLIEVDTQFFKGNYPDRCSIDALDVASGTPITELIDSRSWVSWLEPTPLGPDQRHFFQRFSATGDVTHLRLNIYPDGGVSRLRVWGQRDA